jgi:hypothetical protein
MDFDEKSSITRRKAVGWVSMGMAAAAGGSALAQQTETRSQSQHRGGSEPTMDNPVTKYPKPPFREQTQPWPGLAAKMDPKPDHGETSYRGSGRLTGRKALITGGDSGMGRAAAIAYAREGADVVINHLPSEEPDAREVLQLIKGSPSPVTCARRLSASVWFPKPSRASEASTWWSAMRAVSSRGSPFSSSRPTISMRQ